MYFVNDAIIFVRTERGPWANQ